MQQSGPEQNSRRNIRHLDQLRTKMFERVEGDVLELAVGTGLDLPYYFDKEEGREE